MALGSPKPSPGIETKLRLQKYLALCGLGSRRACEALISQGRVSVDGAVIGRQGVGVDPAAQVVRVAGRRVAPQKKIYILLNKPRDVLCTSHDPAGRRTFRALLPPGPERVYTVGRLDRNTEGLLIITNDGDLAQVLTHPRHEVEKVYQVWIKGRLTPDQEDRLRQGVMSAGERLSLTALNAGVDERGFLRYEVRLKEGRNHQVRRMFEGVGAEVRRLRRVAIGPLKLAHLRCGAWRYLTDPEVARLRQQGPSNKKMDKAGGRS